VARSTNGGLTVRPLASDEEREQCARLMASSEPWITLGRDYETSLRLLADPSREVYVGFLGKTFAGFLILCLQGVFVGYIQTICIAPALRNRGIGQRLLAFAEERIFREWPNVFLCVSSFNEGARRLYKRLRYEQVGELQDYLVRGQSELLLRKSQGPLSEKL